MNVPLALAFSSLFLLPASAADRLYWSRVDDHERPISFYYNACGGDRGLIGSTSETDFEHRDGTKIRMTVKTVPSGEGWTFCGLYNALGHPLVDRRTLDPDAIFHPLIKPEYQPRLTRVRVKVADVASPSGGSDLNLKIELKGFAPGGEEVICTQFSVGRAALLGGGYPKTFTFDLPANLQPIGLINVVLDHARSGDLVEIDDVDLQVALPDAPPATRAILLSLGALLENWNETTGMVDDRSNFPTGVFENVSATAKLAKLLAMGIQMAVIEPIAGRQAIDKIAATLLTAVPRGPAGLNVLWPHFTHGGGAFRDANSEWASGDTAYAVADLAVALQMIGDPQGRLPALMTFIQTIDWPALLAGGYYRHGYTATGVLSPDGWAGFGAETWGVNLVALAGGGPLAAMMAPPTDNGSGFIIHAAYPVPLVGTDRYGNTWRSLRLEEITRQLGWYRTAPHTNPHLVALDFFGLSAAEAPSATEYAAYGIGGRTVAPNDGGAAVVTPHYGGMIAALAPDAARSMLESLETNGFLTPLNSADAMAIDPVGGARTVNWLKGSWNLALYCEGWMFADSVTARAAYDALMAIPEFARAFDTLFPRAFDGEAILTTDGNSLLLLDPAQPAQEQSLGSGTPFTEPTRLSATATRVLFDAKPIAGNNHLAKIYSVAFADLGLGLWQQHTSDPGSETSYDLEPAGQFHLPGIAWKSNRNGSQRWVWEAGGSVAAGFGTSLGGTLGAAAFSKVPGEDRVIYQCPSASSATFERRDADTHTLLSTINYSTGGGTLAVSRLDTSTDGRLLISTPAQGFWHKRLADGILVQIRASGGQAAFNYDGARIVFVENGEVFVADLAPDGTLTHETAVTNTPGRNEATPIWIPRPRFDFDSDGLADVLETVTDWRNPDTDGDGQADGAESIAGTDATSATSRFQIISIVRSAGQRLVTWNSVAGRRYAVERTFDLLSGVWLPVSSEITATAPTTTFALPVAANELKAFVQIRVRP
jgi:hypothetical protein